MAIVDNLISPETAADYRRRNAAYNAWAEQYRQRNGWTVIPAGAVPPEGAEISNAERGLLEQFDVVTAPPEKLFAYVEFGPYGQTTVKVWTGEPLGYGEAGSEYRDNFGGRRRNVCVTIGGARYGGTAFVSAGDYVRLRRLKA